MTKTNFDIDLKKNSDRVTSNKSKHLLVKTKLKKLQKFDSSYFRGKGYFDGDGTQNYLVFQSMYKYFKTFIENNVTFISSWESKGLSNQKVSSTKTSNYDQSPRLVYHNARIKLNFSGSILKQDKITYSYGPIVNIFAVYRLLSKLIIQMLL